MVLIKCKHFELWFVHNEQFFSKNNNFFRNDDMKWPLFDAEIVHIRLSLTFVFLSHNAAAYFPKFAS